MERRKTDEYTEPGAVTRRFWRHIVAVVCAGTILAAGLGKLDFSGGILFGGLLALLNYRWLISSVRGILSTGSPRVPPGTAMGFIFRWLVIAGLGYGAYRVLHFSAAGMLTGLLAPAAAGLMEAGYLGYKIIGNAPGAED